MPPLFLLLLHSFAIGPFHVAVFCSMSWSFHTVIVYSSLFVPSKYGPFDSAVVCSISYSFVPCRGRSSHVLVVGSIPWSFHAGSLKGLPRDHFGGRGYIRERLSRVREHLHGRHGGQAQDPTVVRLHGINSKSTYMSPKVCRFWKRGAAWCAAKRQHRINNSIQHPNSRRTW